MGATAPRVAIDAPEVPFDWPLVYDVYAVVPMHALSPLTIDELRDRVVERESRRAGLELTRRGAHEAFARAAISRGNGYVVAPSLVPPPVQRGWSVR